MPQVRVLGKGARITGGIFSLLFALHTWIWVLRDILELDFAGTWKVWTGALGPTAAGLTDIPATTADDIGLGLLQIAAVFAAFTGAWSAGGLLAVSTVLTLAWRLPVIWHAGLHSETSQYYALRGFFDDPSLDAAASSCVLAVLLCLPLAIVLLAGIRPWTGQPAGAAQPYGAPAQPYGQPPYGQPFPQGMPQQPPQPPQPVQPVQPPEPPLPGECPQRPTGAHAVVAALFFALLLMFSIGWSIHAFATAGGDYFFRLFTGRGTVVALLDVSPGWEWATLFVVGGAASVLAMARTVSARGFSLGLAVLLLPRAITVLWGYLDAGVFFELGDAAPVAGFFGRLQLLITLAGAVTLVVLTLRPGVPVLPGSGPAVLPGSGPAPGAGGFAPFGAPPLQAPGQPPQAPPPPYVPPQPGPAGPPPEGAAPGAPPVAPPVAPPGTPPGTPPPPAGPPPASPPQGGAEGTPGGVFGPPPAY